MAIATILLTTAVVRVVVAYCQPHPNYFWHNDTTSYWGNAESLLRHGVLKYWNWGPPGLSIVLLPFVAAGVSPFDVVVIWQSLLGTLTVLLAMILTERLSCMYSALVAGAILAVYPPLLNLSRQLITETWFIFALFLAIWLLMSDRRLLSLVAGLVAGLSCLMRAPCLGIALAITCVLLYFRNLRSRLVPFLGGVACMLVVGAFLVSRSAGHLALFPQSDETVGIRPVVGGYEEIGPAEIAARRNYLHFMTHSPVQYLKERGISILVLLSPWPFGEDRTVIKKLVIASSDSFVYLLALWAVVHLRRRQLRPELFLVATPVIGSIAFYGLLFSQPRYRWPFMPFLVCLFAIVWGEWRKSRLSTATFARRSP
ncbi:MAG: glycosyltransferase family 39 protein [Deltaproteobacteria bacterium]|nr:glycosyltransferase family 39 protein [Deltaproteobacteria bacterium]